MKNACTSERTYSIRELADRFDVTSRALRFYEQKGLLNPQRRGSTRIYSAADRAKLVLILRGKRVGFSLEDIKEMMEIENVRDLTPAQAERYLDKFRVRIDALKAQREDIAESISELEAGCLWLEERIANREPSDDIKRRARAFEQLADARLSQWPGGHGQ
jgi:DNA-binding transcriptional MerR regulator